MAADFVACKVIPFGINKLTKLQIKAIKKYQDALEHVSHMGIMDVVNQNKKLTCLKTRPCSFIELVAPFCTLLFTLVGPTSPIF